MFTVSLLITCIETDFEIGRSFSQTWNLRDLDLGSEHMTHHRTSLIDLYLQAKFR